MIVDMGTDDTGSDVPSKPRPQRPRTRPPSRSAAGFSSALGTVGATVCGRTNARTKTPSRQAPASAPRSMASQRRRLGFSPPNAGFLSAHSAQSVHNWDEGKARPRAQHTWPAIIALRKLGRRHANDPGEPQGRLKEATLAGRAPGFAGDFAAKGRPAANASGVAKGCFRPPRSVTQIAASDPKPPLDVAGGRPESGPSANVYMGRRP
jgi:hypothetical protein